MADKYNVTTQTIRKWQKRQDVHDLPHTPHTPHTLNTTLTDAQEWLVVKLRKTLLSNDAGLGTAPVPVCGD